MKIKISDLEINDKSWNYGMRKIAEVIIKQTYGLKDEYLPITKADFKNLIFSGYNPYDMNRSFEIQLKIVPKIKFKKGESNASKENN